MSEEERAVVEELIDEIQRDIAGLLQEMDNEEDYGIRGDIIIQIEWLEECIMQLEANL